MDALLHPFYRQPRIQPERNDFTPRRRKGLERRSGPWRGRLSGRSGQWKLISRGHQSRRLLYLPGRRSGPLSRYSHIERVRTSVPLR